MKKILAMSDFGHTGIAESLLPVLRHWHDAGHEIWMLVLGYNGWAAAIDEQTYPWRERILRIAPIDTNSRFGQNDIKRALELSKPDIVITSFDCWMVSYLGRPEIDPGVQAAPKGTLELLDREKRAFTHICYFPLDGAVGGKTLPNQLDEMICSFDVPVTYSRFARDVIKRSINLDVPFIPIAHDPAVYHSIDKLQARKAMGLIPDRPIVGMVATNQYRKRWDEFFAMAKIVHAKRPDVTFLPWTTWEHMISGGFHIPELIYRAGVERVTINPGEQINDLTHDGMANLYSSLDVSVLTTCGEGAGLPPLRSRACGVPALVSNNTSNTEFCGHDFEKIPSHIAWSDNGGGLSRYSTDVSVLAARVLELLDNPDRRDAIGHAGLREMQQYEIDNVMPMWDEILAGAA